MGSQAVSSGEQIEGPADRPQVSRKILSNREQRRASGIFAARVGQLKRRGDRQLVTGLVVNDKVNLPRKRRRWLRAVEHRLKTGKPATLTPQQLAGWRALAAMVRSQSMPG